MRVIGYFWNIGVGKNRPDTGHLLCLFRMDRNISICLLTQNQPGVKHAGDLPVTGILRLSSGLVVHILPDVVLSYIF